MIRIEQEIYTDERKLLRSIERGARFFNAAKHENTLAWLRKDGLIEKGSDGGWFLTSYGMTRVAMLPSESNQKHASWTQVADRLDEDSGKTYVQSEIVHLPDGRTLVVSRRQDWSKPRLWHLEHPEKMMGSGSMGNAREWLYVLNWALEQKSTLPEQYKYASRDLVNYGLIRWIVSAGQEVDLFGNLPGRWELTVRGEIIIGVLVHKEYLNAIIEHYVKETIE